MNDSPASDSLKAEVRATVFAHLRGMVLAPVAKALDERGVFEMLRSPDGWTGLDRIVEKTRGNRGYLKVAMRLLVSAGWLEWRNASGNPEFRLTARGVSALGFAPAQYREIVSFIPTAIFLDDFIFGRTKGPLMPSFQALFARAESGWGVGSDSESKLMALRLDGMLIGPAMVALARHGVLDTLAAGEKTLRELSGNENFLAPLFQLLIARGWMERKGDAFALTAAGGYAASIAHAYGVTVSYLPMFSVVSTLLFGNPRMPRTDENGLELLVNRSMNVWGSGGAHRTYYRKADAVITEIFNRPLELQPSGICDLGCGDGTFLKHLYEVVRDRTARGKALDRFPLLFVGADVNKVSRRITKQTFKRAHIPDHHVIQGDINRPALLAHDLEELGVDVHDLLHVRSFLDHNRAWQETAGYVPGTRNARTAGAFAHRGDEICGDELEENLVRHLRRWAPYVGRFGLLVIELHTIAPELAAKSLERSPVVAYDGTHGFSDQYLVEVPVFLACAREAGLHADARFSAQFPQGDLATVSVNFFTAPQA